jgi:23S rRNA (cytosine1962-C5)-methyltransferase
LKSSGYQLIDSGNFRKLERIGAFTLIRPSPQAVWAPLLTEAQWNEFDAMYTRFSGGDGKWTIKNKKISDNWSIDILGLKIRMKLTDFGHLGIFPEQEPNWQKLEKFVESSLSAVPDFKVLNLFAYTGIASLMCARGGAEVVHVDASKTSVQWGRENAELSGLGSAKLRWIIEDVQKFVGREVRRGSKYHGIILDPPSFGRGTNNEVWKIEEHMVPLMAELKKILADNFKFVLLSSHSTGYTPIALQNLLSAVVDPASGSFVSNEMVVAHKSGKALLPSGASCLFLRS